MHQPSHICFCGMVLGPILWPRLGLMCVSRSQLFCVGAFDKTSPRPGVCSRAGLWDEKLAVAQGSWALSPVVASRGLPLDGAEVTHCTTRLTHILPGFVIFAKSFHWFLMTTSALEYQMVQVGGIKTPNYFRPAPPHGKIM